MASSSTTESGEEQLIRKYFRALAVHPGAFGLQDDAALLPAASGRDFVLNTDPIICGVHFFPDDPPDTVARKALRVNLSDLAAKGATPAGFLLALALPQDTPDAWLAAFAQALGADAEYFQCPLLGGDTDRTPGPLSISIAAFGTVPQGNFVRRSGARPGQRVVVSGTIGDAALGLQMRLGSGTASPSSMLTAVERAHLLGRYRVPEPRTGLASALQIHAAAAMDVSDGLVGDLGKMCRISAVSAEIDVASVPLSAAARSVLRHEPGMIAAMLTGGDDYEILCTLEPSQVSGFCAAAQASGIPVTVIGEIVVGSHPPLFRDASGQLLSFARPSFSHF